GARCLERRVDLTAVRASPLEERRDRRREALLQRRQRGSLRVGQGQRLQAGGGNSGAPRTGTAEARERLSRPARLREGAPQDERERESREKQSLHGPMAPFTPIGNHGNEIADPSLHSPERMNRMP